MCQTLFWKAVLQTNIDFFLQFYVWLHGFSVSRNEANAETVMCPQRKSLHELCRCADVWASGTVSITLTRLLLQLANLQFCDVFIGPVPAAETFVSVTASSHPSTVFTFSFEQSLSSSFNVSSSQQPGCTLGCRKGPCVVETCMPFFMTVLQMKTSSAGAELNRFTALNFASGCESEPWVLGGSSSKCCSSFWTKGSIPLLFFMLRFHCFLVQISFYSGWWGPGRGLLRCGMESVFGFREMKPG